MTATGGGGRRGIPREGARTNMETYNIYMDETPGGDEDAEEGYEVEFRVVPNSSDDGNPADNAVLAGLDLVDLINLRDAIQQEIDNYALQALEAEAGDEDLAAVDDEVMP